jgi:hypothetical protein
MMKKIRLWFVKLGKNMMKFGRYIMRFGTVIFTALRFAVMGILGAIGTISAPVLGIIALVVAAVAALFFLVKWIKKKLGIDSWKDMAKVVVANIVDTIGHILNFFTGIFRWQLKMYR